jgi:NADH-quinone oxidoreductase subunit G
MNLPLVLTPMPERVVWVPTNSSGCPVREVLVVDAGAVVTISKAGAA